MNITHTFRERPIRTPNLRNQVACTAAQVKGYPESEFLPRHPAQENAGLPRRTRKGILPFFGFVFLDRFRYNESAFDLAVLCI